MSVPAKKLLRDFLNSLRFFRGLLSVEKLHGVKHRLIFRLTQAFNVVDGIDHASFQLVSQPILLRLRPRLKKFRPMVGEIGRKCAEQADSGDHQKGGDHPSPCGNRRDIPVAYRRRGHDCPLYKRKSMGVNKKLL